MNSSILIIGSVIVLASSVRADELPISECEVTDSRGWFSTYAGPPPVGSSAKFNLPELAKASDENITVKFVLLADQLRAVSSYVIFRGPIKTTHNRRSRSSEIPSIVVDGKELDGHQQRLEIFSPDKKSGESVGVYRFFINKPVPEKRRLEGLPNNVFGIVDMRCR